MRSSSLPTDSAQLLPFRPTGNPSAGVVSPASGNSFLIRAERFPGWPELSQFVEQYEPSPRIQDSSPRAGLALPFEAEASSFMGVSESGERDEPVAGKLEGWPELSRWIQSWRQSDEHAPAPQAGIATSASDSRITPPAVSSTSYIAPYSATFSDESKLSPEERNYLTDKMTLLVRERKLDNLVRHLQFTWLRPGCDRGLEVTFPEHGGFIVHGIALDIIHRTLTGALARVTPVQH